MEAQGTGISGEAQLDKAPKTGSRWEEKARVRALPSR